MNKEIPNKVAANKPTEPKKPMEAAKDNPVARFLAMVNIVAKKELPVVGEALAAMSIIAILVSIKYISVEFMLILTFLTIAKTAFNAGVVWQRLRSGKGRA